MTTPINLSCLCGASKFTSHTSTSSLPLPASLCHCTSCRHGTGALAWEGFYWPSALPEDVGEKLTRYAFSASVDTYFCPTCGTMMFWHKRGAEVPSVACGAVEGGNGGLEFGEHIFVGDTGDGGAQEWLRVVGGREVRRWRGEGGEGVDARWVEPDAKRDVEGGEELRAHCLCEGVDFRITKPTEETANRHCGDPGENDSCWWLDPTKTKYLAIVCVCDSCRLAAGFNLVPLTYVPKINLKHADGSSIDGYEFGTMKAYRSSEKAVRYFCGRCGACVFFVADKRPDLPDIHVGLLGAKSGALAEDWLYWYNETVDSQKDGDARGSLTRDVRSGMEDWEARKKAAAERAHSSGK